MLAKEPRMFFLKRGIEWAFKNKFASFIMIFTAVYIATIPITHEPKVSTSTERAESKTH